MTAGALQMIRIVCNLVAKQNRITIKVRLREFHLILLCDTHTAIPLYYFNRTRSDQRDVFSAWTSVLCGCVVHASIRCINALKIIIINNRFRSPTSDPRATNNVIFFMTMHTGWFGYNVTHYLWCLRSTIINFVQQPTCTFMNSFNLDSGIPNNGSLSALPELHSPEWVYSEWLARF